MHLVLLGTIMAVLDLIFPALFEDEGRYFLPEWPEKNAPWSILSSNGKYCLISQLNNLIKELDFVNKIPDNVTIDISNGPVYIHPESKIGQYVRIEGPAYIGSRAEVRHGAYLREGSWICEGAVVGHATEIKNSILLPRSKAPHFNYVGDSILGFDVNLGAGTKISNVRNDRRNILITLQDGTRIDTELRKFGALIGDKAELGCNVVSNPGTIIIPKSMIEPNLSIKGWFGNNI